MRLGRIRLSVLAASLAAATATQASEGGASVYLLGSGGPGAAVLPPIEGVFFANTFYHYDGEAGRERQFTVGGNLVAGLEAKINADFATVLWIPTTDLAGGTLALGAALPLGVPDVQVDAVITGPRGGQRALSKGDDAFVIGDPLLTAALGWNRGKWSYQVSALANIPIGDYRDGQLANLAFHRWALDTSAAVTWRDKDSGWDLSAKTGVTFNGSNDSTDYDTGNEWHAEASIEKTLSPKFSVGLQAYYFSQITGDSGAGAALGPFKGQVTGVGATAAYNFEVGQRPATLRLHLLTEMDAKNRLEGDAVFLDFTIPLHMNLPAPRTP